MRRGRRPLRLRSLISSETDGFGDPPSRGVSKPMALETPLPGGSLALHPHPLPSTAFALPAGTLLWVSDTVFECVSTSGRVLYLSPHPTRSPAFLLSASDGSYAVTFTAASILPLALTDIDDVHYIHTGIHLSDT